jgi:cation transport protein ChaC
MTTGFWTFGYGSLMWDPGFAHAERAVAVLDGYRRALCVVSRRHRGTAEVPGLVMGLAPEAGARCTGIAYRVAPADAEAVRAYLWEREVPGYIYREATVDIALADGRRMKALTYLPDPTSPDFVPHLSDEEILARIKAAHGGRGPNIDYLRNTVAHLEALGIEEAGLRRLLKAACRA